MQPRRVIVGRRAVRQRVDRREPGHPGERLLTRRLALLRRSRGRSRRRLVGRITADERLPLAPVILAEDAVRDVVVGRGGSAQLLFPALHLGDAVFERDIVGPLLGRPQLRLLPLVGLVASSFVVSLLLQLSLDERRLCRYVVASLRTQCTV